MIGPGKYDKLSEHCLNESKAEAVVLLVFQGEKGHGVSVKIKLTSEFEVCVRNMAVLNVLPDALRNIASAIERDRPKQN